MGRSAVVGSNPVDRMDVLCCVCCVGSGLYDGLITLTEESYRVCVCVCLIVCDLETSTKSGSGTELGLLRHRKTINVHTLARKSWNLRK